MRSRNALYVLGVAAVSTAAYINALFNNFVYDDLAHVLDNPWIRDLGHIPEIFSRGAWDYYHIGSNYYRPTMHLIYGVTFRFFGPDPFWFHLLVVAFHAGVCVLLFLITYKILERYYGGGRRAALAAFAAAALFAVHPVHTEAVAWVAGISDVSYSFFFLLSFLLYMAAVEGPAFRKAPYAASLAAFFVALLSKEPAVTLPLLLPAFDLALRRSGLRENLRRYAPYLAVTAGYFIMRAHALSGFMPNELRRPLTPWQEAFNVLPLFWWYVVKLLLPFNLNVFHTYTPAASPADVGVLLSLVCSALLVLSLLAAYKRRGAALFGALLFVLPLLPALYIPGLGRNIFTERYLYLPSAGFCFLLSLPMLEAGKSGARRAASLAAVSLAAAVLLPGTLARNTVWKSDYTLWTDSVAKSPGAATPHCALGTALLERGRVEESIKQFRTAIGLEPEYASAYENLGNAYSMTGRVDEAIGQYAAALRLRPKSASVHENLGIAYGKKGLYGRAVAEEVEAIRLNPDLSQAHFNLGIAYYKMGMKDKAVEEVSTACRMRPEEKRYKKFLDGIVSR